VTAQWLNHPAVRRLLPVAIAVVLGPLVAGLIVFACYFGIMIADRANWPPGVGEALLLVAKMFVLIIAIAYFGGALVALIAGVLIALWMLWRPPNLVVVVVAAALGTLAAFVTTGRHSVQALVTVSLAQALRELALVMMLAVIAATICWFLMRRFVRPA
jgi:hypothetical protein